MISPMAGMVPIALLKAKHHCAVKGMTFTITPSRPNTTVTVKARIYTIKRL